MPRRGELIGMKWADIDFENLQVDVPLGGASGRGQLQDRSIAKAGSARWERCRRPMAMEAEFSLQPTEE